MSRRFAFAGLLGLIAAVTVRADGPRDNRPEAVRPIPPPGIAVPPDERRELDAGLASLEAAIANLKKRKDAKTIELLPDVQIFAKAVHDALTYQELFAPQDINKAKALLEAGRRRAGFLYNGTAPWTSQTGLVVRGYVSRIDGSVQPYGLVIPGPNVPEDRPVREADVVKPQAPYRLDVWFHGRGETLSEVNFLDEHRKQPGLFTPPDTIVLHPYGRYCNAFRFAGEVDVLESIEAVRKNYRIDDDRVSVRGFSMGGAACWQFAVHYTDRWFAANPGAGFSETARFLKNFQGEKLQPTSYQKTLWHMYDSTDHAANLMQCPTVAYSGALDSQKQAADAMAEALHVAGMELLHVIGPGTKHAYHPEAKLEVERRMNLLAAKGRDSSPSEVTLIAYTLKYPKMHWVTLDGLGEHWKRARVHAKRDGSSVVVETENVTALTLNFPTGSATFPLNAPVEVTIDGTKLKASAPFTDRSWKSSFRRAGNTWERGEIPGDGLRKRQDLQGPIDDAFMDSFVFVRPTGKAAHEKVQSWVEKESTRAVDHWRKQFRGDARVKDDSAISEDDIRSSNLVLWGDPESNSVLKRIVDRLPISWTRERIKAGDREFPADSHALVLIYPNPLNPKRYVVLNSGFTYRDFDYLNNARQVAKLPDWAVVDLSTPPDSMRPGEIPAADFFGERWELRPAAKPATESKP